MKLLAGSEILELYVCNTQILDTFMYTPDLLLPLFGLQHAEKWSVQSTQVLKLTQHCVSANPDCAKWYAFLAILKGSNIVVGCGGYKGQPDVSKTVEIYYEIAPLYQNKGYGREMVRLLIINAFSYKQVNKIRANTQTENNYSIRILEFFGFTVVSESFHTDGSIILHWEFSRKKFHH